MEGGLVVDVYMTRFSEIVVYTAVHTQFQYYSLFYKYCSFYLKYSLKSVLLLCCENNWLGDPPAWIFFCKYTFTYPFLLHFI